MHVNPLSEFFLEVVDRSGQVRERISLDEDPLVLGRGYDSDVIVDDVYLCRHHIHVRLDDDGQLHVEDLATVNGLSRRRHGVRENQLTLLPGEDCYIGWTKLRFRSRQSQVAPARVDLSRQFIYGALQQPGWLVLLISLPFLHLYYVTWLEQASEVEWHSLMIAPATVFTVLCLWAMVWAIIGRVLVHRAMFLTHLAIGAVLASLTTIVESLVSYMMFVFDMDSMTMPLLHTTGFIASVLVFYLHLHFASRMKFRMQVVTAVGISAIIGLVSLYVDFTNREAFNPVPVYHVTLKPPAYKPPSQMSADDFFAGMDEIRRQLDDLVDDPVDDQVDGSGDDD